MNKYITLVLLGFALWLLETAYFGWNMKPKSAVEAILDSVSVMLIAWGIIGDVLNGLLISKVTEVKAEKVYIQK